MPVFRVTKKLSKPLAVKLERVEPVDPEREWFADLFYVERKKAVIWVHRATLLTFVRPAVTMAELREFHGLFRYELRTAIASMGLPESLIDRVGAYEPASFAATDDRRIVGSMVDYRHLFTHGIAHDGGLARADVAAINMFLNSTPMSVIGMDTALRRLRATLAAPKLH